MNQKDITQCGYAGSDMVKAVDRSQATTGDCTQLTKDATGLGTGTLKEIYNNYIEPDFKVGEKSHVIEYQNLLTNAMDKDRINRFGVTSNNANLMGASSDWSWYTRKLDLMSEMNVYGGIVASSSMYDTGIDNRQYAIFILKPELMYSYGDKQFTVSYWLKDVVSSTGFATVAYDGVSHTPASDASSSLGVRPRFLIG